MTGFTLDAFVLLAVASVIGAVGVVPMSTHFIRNKLTDIEIPPVRAAALSAFQGGVLAIASAAGGLIFAGWAGFEIPTIRSLASGDGLPSGAWGELGLGLLLGFGSGAILLVMEWGLFWNFLPDGLRRGLDVEWWKRLPASLYGGIAEEVITRLFFLSLFAWALSFVWEDEFGHADTPAVWIAIFLSALVFGLLHLPATYILAPITRVVVVRTLALNGVVGIAAGWMFVEYGLAAAMATHWAADIVVLMIAPSLQPLFHHKTADPA